MKLSCCLGAGHSAPLMTMANFGKPESHMQPSPGGQVQAESSEPTPLGTHEKHPVVLNQQPQEQAAPKSLLKPSKHISTAGKAEGTLHLDTPSSRPQHQHPASADVLSADEWGDFDFDEET
jgi:hypothetical protein